MTGCGSVESSSAARWSAARAASASCNMRAAPRPLWAAARFGSISMARRCAKAASAQLPERERDVAELHPSGRVIEVASQCQPISIGGLVELSFGTEHVGQR